MDFVRLEQAHEWSNDAPPSELIARLRRHVHVHTEPFRLTFKLSGGGIVSRVMEHPETTRTWYGELSSERLRLVAMPDDTGITPYQPIVRGSIDAEGSGSRIRLSLAPHPGVNTYAVPFALLGAVLLIYALMFMADRPVVALCAATFALGFLIFPTLRARLSFERDCAHALARLRRCLGTPESAENADTTT